jgi:hypothetical protein
MTVYHDNYSKRHAKYEGREDRDYNKSRIERIRRMFLIRTDNERIIVLEKRVLYLNKKKD